MTRYYRCLGGVVKTVSIKLCMHACSCMCVGFSMLLEVEGPIIQNITLEALVDKVTQ